MSLIEQADEFAAWAHRNQKRKYTGDPYIIHPRAVAAIVRTVHGHTPEMICAALLHDTVEDCGVSLMEILVQFGPQVAELVEWLSDVSKPGDGNRAARKALDRAHIARAPWEAQVIKLADLLDNTATITQHDPDFAKVYMREKKLLLEVLVRGDCKLWMQANARVNEWEAANAISG